MHDSKLLNLKNRPAAWSASQKQKHTLATQPVQARCTRERGHIHTRRGGSHDASIRRIVINWAAAPASPKSRTTASTPSCRRAAKRKTAPYYCSSSRARPRPGSCHTRAPSPVGVLRPHAWLCMPYKGDVEVQVALNIVDVKRTTHAFRAVSFGDHKDVTAAETVKVEGLAAPDEDGWGVVKTFQTGDLTGARRKYKVHARLASVKAVPCASKTVLGETRGKYVEPRN